MGATSGQGNDMVNSEILRGMRGNSPPWAVITMTSPVLCQHCPSYCSVPTGVAPAVCTATLALTLG